MAASPKKRCHLNLIMKLRMDVAVPKARKIRANDLCMCVELNIKKGTGCLALM